MIVIAILVVPFCIYFIKIDYSSLGRSDEFGRMYDRKVSMVEFQRHARLGELARQLGMFSFLQDLTAGAQDQNSFYIQFTINLIILRHEAERLGVRSTKAEIVDLVQNLRAFRGPNGFDSKKFDEFTQNFLSPNGFTEAEVEQLASNELALNKIKQLVAAGVSVSETESKSNFEQLYGKMTVSVARLKLEDLAKKLKIGDDAVAEYYEAHKAELKTEEKRKVEFVSLALTDEQKKLAGKERIDVLQKLADRANDFSQAMLEKGADFKQVAAKFQLPVRETGEFTPTAPDPQFKDDPQLSATAFQLNREEPNSDAIQGGNGFYILHLSNVVEARPLTLEEAKPKIVETITAKRSREMLSTNGMKAAHDLRESLKSGAPLTFALEKTNLKIEKIPPFSLADERAPQADPKKAEKEPKEPEDLPAIKRAVQELNAGDVSEFFPTNDGGLIAIVEKRDPPDESKSKEKATLDERYLSNKRRMVFYEWLHERQNEARVELAKAESEPAATPQAPPS